MVYADELRLITSRIGLWGSTAIEDPHPTPSFAYSCASTDSEPVCPCICFCCCHCCLCCHCCHCRHCTSTPERWKLRAGPSTSCASLRCMRGTHPHASFTYCSHTQPVSQGWQAQAGSPRRALRRCVRKLLALPRPSPPHIRKCN